MATVHAPPVELTAEDIAARFGPMPIRRIVTSPPPGTATVEDIDRHRARTGRVCELVDGILVEKPMGRQESKIACELIYLMKAFLRRHRLAGEVTGEAGGTTLPTANVRMPDVAYTAAERLPAPAGAYPELVPNLAVEVLSPGNTRQEMDEKLDEYFASGVELVWYVDPQTRTVRVYTSRNSMTTLLVADTLTGGTVLPGFAVPVRELFGPATGPAAEER